MAEENQGPTPTHEGLTGAFAENAGVRIYYEMRGSGPPLLLHHGFTGSVEQWKMFGYVEAFADHHRVIALDARGHGKSGKPHDPEDYAMDTRADDIGPSSTLLV